MIGNGKLDETVFQEALKQWGEEAQIHQCIEEMGEVLVAFNHLNRGRIEKGELIEEFVDVYIMMCQMRYMNQELFDQIYEFKVNRLRQRLGLL